MNNTEKAKIKAAEAALNYVSPNQLLGVGTGSTVSLFIDSLAAAKVLPKAAVPTSIKTEMKLLETGFKAIAFEDMKGCYLFM